MNALLQGVALVTLRKRRQAAALQSASRRGGQAARNSDLRLLISEPIRVISVIRGPNFGCGGAALRNPWSSSRTLFA